MVEKIHVAVLGATGTVGQRFIELLNSHPIFFVAGLGASERSAGKTYKDACNWKMTTTMPKAIAAMKGKDYSLSFSLSLRAELFQRMQSHLFRIRCLCCWRGGISISRGRIRCLFKCKKSQDDPKYSFNCPSRQFKPF